MKCPVCKDVNLMMADRQGIEIDYCPECRGVWLDRGELDKIIERTNQESGPRDRYEERRPVDHDRRYDDEKRYGHDKHSDQYKHKKKKGLLGELLDF